MSFQKSAAILCLLVFFAINITSLNARPVTLDDIDSLKHTINHPHRDRFDLLQTIASVAQHSPEHVPAYYSALDLWLVIVGEDLFLTRLFSVFLCLLALALTYRLALLTRNRQVAAAAPFILAFMAYLQYYAQITRVYALLPLVTGWALWAYWQAVASPTVSRWKWLSLFTSVLATIYTHYIGIIVLAGVALYHLIFVPKDRRWWHVVLIVVLASLPFILWLPVAFRGFARSQTSLAKDVLALPEAFSALLRIYANGLLLVPLGAAAILWLRRRRLNGGERYLVFVALAVFLLILLVNEISPILVARRMRYTLVLAVPLSCAFAIAVCRLPGGSVLRLPLLALWVASSVVYADSMELSVYTNQFSLDFDNVPHYQDFIYEAAKLPGHNEPILSFLPPVSEVARWSLGYYREQLSDWTHVISMYHDHQGQLRLASSLSTYATPEALIENSQGIWLIHNPTRTSDSALEEDFGWFTQHFRFCKRYLEKPKSIIDFYLKSSIPCELVTDEQPLAIRYDNGAELGNLIYDRTTDSLTVFLRWLRTIDKVYSFTLQVFDERANKLAQFDKVISGDPIDIAPFDLAAFPAGEYVVKLIVYDRESIASQPGLLLSDQQPFEREMDVLRFSVQD